MSWKKYLPITSWLPQYQKQWLKGDVSAGITVGIMLIPQGMAYAMLAGLPPIYGLYASIFPLILYAIFGTSRQLAVGPVAMDSLLVAAGVGTLAATGTAEYIALAIALALMVGLIQFTMGIFKLGFLVNFLSQPVISGFVQAAALIIGFSQLKHLLGIELASSTHIHEIIIAAIAQMGQINFPTFLIGLSAIGIILGIKKANFPIPGQLVVVILGILLVWLGGLNEMGVKIVEKVPEGLPSLALPILDWEMAQPLFLIALPLAFIGFMESIAIAKALQKKHNHYKIIPDQELIGLGMANMGGALFQAFPVAGGFGRSAVNEQAGAQTGLASIISATLIILTLLFLTPLFYYLPNAVLAAVIMVAVFGLINFSDAKQLWATDRSDFWMLVITFLGTLFLGIKEGIMIGVLLSIIMIIYRTTRPHVAVLGKIPDEPYYRNVKRFSNLEIRKEILIVRFDALLYFANVNYLQTMIEDLLNQDSNIRLLILDADTMHSVDSSGVAMLKEVWENCQQKGIELYFADLKGPVRDIFKRTHLTEMIGEENFFFCIQNAVDYYDKKSGHPHQNYTLQTNV